MLSEKEEDRVDARQRKSKQYLEKVQNRLAYEEEQDALDLEFERQLDKDANTDSDSHPSDNPQSRSARRREKKRAKKTQKKERFQQDQERQTKASELSSILAKSSSSARSKDVKAGKELVGYLDTINAQIAEWASQGSSQDYDYNNTLLLPPMPQAIRRPLIVICKMYFCTPKVQGSNKKKCLLLHRTSRTSCPTHWKTFVSSVLGGHINKQPPLLKGNIAMGARPSRKETKGTKKNSGMMDAFSGGGTGKAVEGSKVGASASLISSENVGHKMLRMMGWKPGQGLGVEGGDREGIVDPIDAIVRGKRRGLGA